MNCVEVLRSLITRHSLDQATFLLIEHAVGKNWREKHLSTQQKINHIAESLVQIQPVREWRLLGANIVDPAFSADLLSGDDANVISLCSIVTLESGELKHLALMNLHPDPGVGITALVGTICMVTSSMPGHVLSSGRYFHFYGADLLNAEEWIRFMAQFLMPTIVVSPRYIGHSLYRGYAALRITTQHLYKPVLYCSL